MNYQNLFKIAIRAIAANKMRSFLTALGIIIGIAAVITMLAIGQGSKASIKANIAEMGFKHDYDFTRCRHAWRCETGCFVNGDAEASRLSEHQRRM